MISDLAKISLKWYAFLAGLFTRKEDEPPLTTTVLEDVISKITQAQNESIERLNNITDQASALLKTLTEKEQEQLAHWKGEIQKILESEGVDCAYIDEFLKDPSLQRLEEFREKYPGVRK